MQRSLANCGNALAMAVATILSGCATVFDGTSQEISVVSNPPGATCVFERQGYEVGRIVSTPGTANIRKNKYDLLIRCNKPGYAETSYLNHSGTTATIAANVAADLIFTAGISSIVDSADGADNKYDSAVNISLMPLATSVAFAQPPFATAAQAYGPTPLHAPSAQPSPAWHAASQSACGKEDQEVAKLAQEQGYRYSSSC